MAQEICIKWNGKEFNVAVEETETIEALKHKLEGLTSVQSKRQKLLGLKTKDGKPATDDAPVGSLALKPGVKVMMMG